MKEMEWCSCVSVCAVPGRSSVSGRKTAEGIRCGGNFFLEAGVFSAAESCKRRISAFSKKQIKTESME